MKFSSTFLAALAGLGIAAVSPSAEAITLHVNCDKGQTITEAIQKAASRADQLEILVRGTCEENVVIGRDYVLIDGGGTAVIVGRVRISEARGTRLQDPVVTGPGEGVVVSLGGSLLLQRVRLVSNESTGLVLHRGSFARLHDCTVSDNGGGVALEQGTMDAAGSVFSNDTAFGIEGDVGSNVIVRTSEVSRNVEGGIALGLHSVADIRDGTGVFGNGGDGAHLAGDSGLRLAEGVLFSEGIYCADRESSFSSDGAVVTGPIACSSFDE